MVYRQMQFLDHVCLRLRCFDANITHILQLAIFCARQTDDFHSFGMSCRCRIKDVFAVSARGNAKEHISQFSVTINLLREAE